MNKSLSLVCLLCGGTALLCMAQNAHLQTQLNDLKSKSESFQNCLCSGPLIQSNLFLNPRWVWQGFDLETRTASVEVFLTPAERDGAGTVTLKAGETDYPLAFRDGIYTAVLTLPLFAQTEISCAEFVPEQGPDYCQNLNWTIAPRYQYLPQMNAGFEGSPDIRFADGRVSFAYKGNLRVDAYDSTGFPLRVQALNLVLLQNGVEVQRTPLQVGNQYEGSQPRSNFSTVIPLEETFWVTAGTKMQLQVELDDGQGLRYISVIGQYQTGADGSAVSRLPDWGGGECRIYSSTGELLFDPGIANSAD